MALLAHRPLGNLEGLMRTTISANLERTKTMRLRSPLARSVTTKSPFCRSKTCPLLTLMAICHFDLCEPTCEQIKGSVDPHDNALGTQTLPMGSINQQDPSQACSDEPGRGYHCHG